MAVQCSADTFVVNQNLVLRINICGENRHLSYGRGKMLELRVPRTREGDFYPVLMSVCGRESSEFAHQVASS